jgi:hypothetical protein
MDLNDQANRLRALWKSGRDKYASFFTTLEEVRAEIGDNALQAWCAQSLQISLSTIAETRKVLIKVDADIVKRNLAAAVAAEKAETRNAREAKRKQREDEAHARNLAKEKRAQELEEEKLRTEEKKSAVDQAKTKRKTTKRRKHMAAEFTEELASANLNDLSERFKSAEAHCRHGINEWIEGSIAKAIILATARELLVADQDFGAWCDDLINLGKTDRAALVSLGRLGESKLRELFKATDSRSYELIWRRYKPELRVLEGSVSE